MSRSRERGEAAGRTRSRSRSNPWLPHPFSMTWRDGLFCHWPVDPDRLRPHVPDPLELDTREGRAYLSVLPFVLAHVGVRGSPAIARLAFPELNVRTSVRYDGDPGLFFFAIDVDSALIASTVGALTRLPVHRARMHVTGADDEVAFSSARSSDGRGTRPTARFSATYRPEGSIFHGEPGTLPYWLVERRRLYAPEDGGVLTAELSHAPWPLREVDATIHENTMFAATDLPTPAADPIAHFCGDLSMTGSIARRLRR